MIGTRQLARGVEALEAALEVNARQWAQRLDLRRVEGTVQVDPALAGPELPVERRGGDPEVPDDEAEGGRRVVQLVRGDPDVVELLGHGQRHAVAIVERAAASRQHPPLGAAALGQPGPLVALHDLELDRAGQQRQHAEGEADLDHGDPRRRLGHQGPSSGSRWQRQKGELRVGRLVQAEAALGQRNQHLPAGGHPDLPLQLGPPRLQRRALLPKLTQTPRGAEAGALPGGDRQQDADEHDQPQHQPVPALKPHARLGRSSAWRSGPSGWRRSRPPTV